MLGLQASELLLPAADPARTLAARRKSIPNRSSSREDAVPGIVFRVDSGVRVLDGTGDSRAAVAVAVF